MPGKVNEADNLRLCWLLLARAYIYLGTIRGRQPAIVSVAACRGMRVPGKVKEANNPQLCQLLLAGTRAWQSQRG